jgi:hypothetical protein
MKKVLIVTIGLLVALSLALGGLICLFNDEKFLVRQIVLSVNQRSSGLVLKELDISEIQWAGAEHFSLKGVVAKFDQAGVTYQFDAKEIKVDWEYRVLRSLLRFQVGIPAFNVDSEKFQVSSAQINLSGEVVKNEIQNFEGQWKAQELKFDKYIFNEPQSLILGTVRQIALRDFQTGFASGKIHSDIVCSYPPQINYTLHAEFEHIDIKKLAQNSQEMDFRGLVSGVFSVSADTADVHDFYFEIKESEGSEIKAGLLQAVIERIPAGTQQRKELDKLLSTKSFIPLDAAFGYVESVAQGSSKGEFEIYSQKLNLAVKYPIQINTDGKWSDLIKQGNWLAPLKEGL